MKLLMKYRMVISIAIIQSVEQNSLNEINYERNTCNRKFNHLEKGVKNVIISMGSRGAYVKSDNFTGIVPAVKVRVVDITAVGDVFNGALAVALAEGNDFRNAVIFANKAASISATRMGAQASAPYRKELSDLHLYALTGSYAHFSFLPQFI